MFYAAALLFLQTHVLQNVHIRPLYKIIYVRYNLTQLAFYKEAPMATTEQIEQILQLFGQVRPVVFIQHINKTSAGIGAVLRFLHEAEEPVTAGKISEFMGVSTARVAVLLKKMAAKGLISKQAHPSDARITIVELSALGQQTVARMHKNLCAEISAIIDQIGMERLLEFAAISREIQAIIKCPPFDF